MVSKIKENYNFTRRLLPKGKEKTCEGYLKEKLFL